MGVGIGLLGDLQVTVAGEPVARLAPRQRAVIARLAQDPRVAVSVDRLLEDVWGADRPASGAKAVAFQVKRIRDVVEPARGDTGSVVRTATAGYELDVDPEAIDAHRFVRLVTEARAAVEDDPEKARDLLQDALVLWRGRPYADVPDAPWVDDEVRRLDEVRLLADRLLAEARLALGEDEVLVPELFRSVDAHPYEPGLLACLMTALHRAGRTAEALSAYARHRDRMAEDLGLDPAPSLVALESAILRDDPAVAAPGGARATNLPARLTGLVGREEETSGVLDLVRAGRLVTLTGPGGTGKTRLAEHVGERLQADVRDGVWLVALDSVEEPRFVHDRFAEALDLRAAEGVALADVVTEHLRSREIVLIVDNCEHLADTVAEVVGDLLAAAPGLRVLATSREALRLPGEVVYPVPPLSMQDGHAETLFVERMREVRPGRDLDGAQVDAVRRICAAVGGLPLGIELAAVRTRSSTPGEIADRLEESLDLLRDPRARTERRRSMDATVRWSYDLLDDAEQRLLRRLAVTAGGFDHAMAAAVAPDVPSVAQVVEALADRSLLQVQDGPDSTVRFRLLEPIRRFALDRLVEESGDGERRARASHADAVVALAHDAESRLRGPDQLAWGRRLHAERDNIRVGLASLLDAGRIDDHLDVCWDLFWHFQHDSRHVEAIDAMVAALTAVDTGAEASPFRVARAWLACSALALDITRPEAVGYAEKGIALAEQLDRPTLLGHLLVCKGLAEVNTSSGTGIDALEAGERVLAGADDGPLRDPSHDAAVLDFWRGWARHHDDGPARRASFERAAAGFAGLGDRMMLCASQLLTALVVGSGDAELDGWVDRSLDAGVATARVHGSRHQLGHALLLRAQVDAYLGRQRTDPRDLLTAARLLAGIGDQACWATAASLAAGRLIDADDDAGAIETIAPVMRVVRGGGLPIRRVRVLAVAAAIAADGDRPDVASVLADLADGVELPGGVAPPDVAARLDGVRRRVAASIPGAPPRDLGVGGLAAACDAFLGWAAQDEGIAAVAG